MSLPTVISSPATSGFRIDPRIDIDTGAVDVLVTSFSFGGSAYFYRGGACILDLEGWPPGSGIVLPPLEPDSKGTVKGFAEAHAELDERILNRCRVLNCLLFCAQSAMVSEQSNGFGLSQEFAPDNYMPLRVTFDQFDQYTNFFVETVFNQFGKPRSVDGAITTLKPATVAKVVSLMNLIFEDDDLPVLIEMLHRAALRYQRSDFSVATSLMWSVIERLLNRIWSSYLADLQKSSPGRINRRRMDFLTGNSFQAASTTSEVLELVGAIPFGIYARLGSVRKARNAWVHKATPISQDEASAASTVALELLQLVTGASFYQSLFRSSNF